MTAEEHSARSLSAHGPRSALSQPRLITFALRRDGGPCGRALQMSLNGYLIQRSDRRVVTAVHKQMIAAKWLQSFIRLPGRRTDTSIDRYPFRSLRADHGSAHRVSSNCYGICLRSAATSTAAPPVVSKRAANQPQNLADSFVGVGATPSEASGPRDRTLEYPHHIRRF